jgi:hypothetical protein
MSGAAGGGGNGAAGGLAGAALLVEARVRGSDIGTMDPRLGGDFVEHEVSLVLRLGLLCSHPLAGARPTTQQIAQYVDGDLKLLELSPTYEPVFQSASPSMSPSELAMQKSAVLHLVFVKVCRSSLSLDESQSLSLMLERVDRGHGPGLINETSRGFNLWLVHT